MESVYKRDSLEYLTATSQTLALHLESVRSSGQISQYVADLIRHEWLSLSDQLARMGVLQNGFSYSGRDLVQSSYLVPVSNLSSPEHTAPADATSGRAASPLTSPSCRTRKSDESSMRSIATAEMEVGQRVSDEANALSWHRKVDDRLTSLESIWTRLDQVELAHRQNLQRIDRLASLLAHLEGKLIPSQPGWNSEDGASAAGDRMSSLSPAPGSAPTP